MQLFYSILLTSTLLVGVILPRAYAQTLPADTTKPGPIRPRPQAQAQSDLGADIPLITPRSPTAAALSRYGDYPVSLYTGLPTIEIPIHEFKIGLLTVPIKLTYHAAGIRVNDIAPWVGLGWSLRTGGMISRTVVGRPDEQGGVLGKSITDPNTFNYSQCSNGVNDPQMAGLNTNLTDNNRDLFSYQTPASNNSFILTPAAPGYVLLSPEPMNLSVASGLQSFTLTDATGTGYRFTDQEITGTNSTAPNAYSSFTSTWYLNEITSFNTSDRALYTYSTAQSGRSAPEPINTWVVNGALNESSGAPSGVQTGIVSRATSDASSSVFARFPTEIQFPGGSVRFVAETTARTDGVYNLDYIDVMGYDVTTNTYTLIKRYDLQYGTQTQPIVQGGTYLTGVRLLQADAATVVGIYALTYEATPRPATNSIEKDYWGYYNNNTGSTLIQKRFFTYVERTSAPGQSTIIIGDAEREPTEARMKAGILQSIRYPTGGLTTFDFETNRYLDGSAVKLAGGLRIRQIKNYTAANQLASVKTYRYGTSESGVGTFRSILAKTYTPTLSVRFNQTCGTCSPASYNYMVYNFTSAPTYPLTPDEGSPVTYPEVAEYSEDGAGNNTGKTVSQFRDASADGLIQLAPGKAFVTSRRWDRGQLSRQIMFNAAGQLVAQTINDYASINSGTTSALAGALVLRFEQQTGDKQPFNGCYQQGDRYVIQTYNYGYGVVKLIRSSNYLYHDDQSGRFTLKVTETDYDPTYILPRETRLLAEGGAGSGNIVVGTQWSYPQDFGTIAGTVTTPEMLGIRAMQRRNVYLPVETIQFRQESRGAAKDIKTGSLTTYKTATINGQETALPYQIYRLETDYTSFGSGGYQSSAQRYGAAPGAGTFPVDPRFVLRASMNNYDGRGNLTSFSLANGPATSYSYSSYSPTGGVVFSTLQAQTQNAGAPSAQTQSYTYGVPTVGPRTMTDARGVTTTYTYDGFGRLQSIRDKDNNLLKQYSYRYTTQP